MQTKNMNTFKKLLELGKKYKKVAEISSKYRAPKPKHKKIISDVAYE